MLYGTVPFKADDMNELHDLILQGNYTMPEGVSSGAIIIQRPRI
jgi:hypothetical protein